MKDQHVVKRHTDSPFFVAMSLLSIIVLSTILVASIMIYVFSLSNTGINLKVKTLTFINATPFIFLIMGSMLAIITIFDKLNALNSPSK